MYKVDVYLRVRRAVMVEGMSVREAAREFGLHRDTVRKMLEYSVPPGYRRQEHGGQREKLVHSVKDFRIGDWTADLDADYECLGGILSQVEGIGPEDDDKLQGLKRFLVLQPQINRG